MTEPTVGTHDRVGDWIQTVSGRQAWPCDMRPEDIDLRDIAHALANQCRFAGHTKAFYSVAQHCVLLSRVVPPEDALWGLLHDAGEAYLCDVPRPLKRLPEFAGYKRIEALVMAAVCQRFGLTPDQPESVSAADMVMLATEARDLMAPLHPDWHHQQKNGYAVLQMRIDPWSPGRSEHEFLTRFQTLAGVNIP